MSRGRPAPPEIAFEPRTFRVSGLPATQGSHKVVGRPGSIPCRVCNRRESLVVPDNNHKLLVWRRAVHIAAEAEWGQEIMLDGVRLSIQFRLSAPAYIKAADRATREPLVSNADLDKLVRAVGDALKGVVYKDDGQITELNARKVYGVTDADVGAIITVRPSTLGSTVQPALLP